MLHYSGFTLVGHCTSKDLITHVFEFITNLKLNVDYLLNIGRDGAAKNKSVLTCLELTVC